MKKLLNYIVAGVFAMLVASPIAATALPAPVSANADCETTILGIPPWYRGLTQSNCDIKSPNDVGGISNFIWLIVLNVIQIGLLVAAYIAFFFIVYGGFLFLTGGSNPSQIEKGRKSIFNAVIGLVIALGAVAITNFIFGIVTTTESIGDIEGIAVMTDAELVRNVLNIAFFAAGTVAVIVIVIAGLMYTTSSGDTGKVTKAKNMLTFSVAGLVIIILAYAITQFVVMRFAS